MKITFTILAILVLLILLSQTYLAMAQTETQKYKIIKTEKDFEIRLYPPAILASVSMGAKTYEELASPGFTKLASFIFGSNNANKNISMTTPVHMNINDSLSSMSFVMPGNYSMSNLPKPNDTSISIKTTQQEYVAAIKFSGYANDEEINKYKQKLRKSLMENGIECYQNFRFLGYNPPYQFIGRKNEIIVSILYNE